MSDADKGAEKDPEAKDEQAAPAPAPGEEVAKVEEDKGGHGILYGLDSKPPLPKATVLALQHVLTMFGATVAVPLLLGPAMQMSPQNIAILISSVMLCSGLATLCQVTIGTKLPIIQGVSFSFLAPFFAIIGFVASEVSKGAVAPEMQGQVTMQYIAGSVLVGSVFEIIIGYTGLIGLLKKYLTPVVIGPVIMLIGLSLFQHGAPKAGADVFVSGITIIAIIVFSLVLSRKHQFFRLFPILLSVILAWTLCTVLSAAKVFEPDTVLVSTKDMGLTEDAKANAKLLAERYVAVKKGEVLALQGQAKTKSAKLGGEITALYEKIRNTEGKKNRDELKAEIDKLVTEKNKEDASLSSLSGMLGRVYKGYCIVNKGQEQKLKTVSLSDFGVAPLWRTDLTKEMTLVSMEGSAGSTLAVGHPSYVYLDKVSDSPVFRDPTTLVFPWGWPAFNLGFIIAVLFAYLASMIESFGDYHACSYMAGGGTPTPRQISNGIGSEGVGCAITGVMGGFASTSYSENIGLIGMTKVASRYVVIISSIILIVLGLFSKFGALAATLPSPVVGALYCTLFGLISAVGIQQLSKADLASDRTLFIAGFSLFMGLSVPTFFTAKLGGMTGPGDIHAVYLPTAEVFLSWFPKTMGEIIATVGKSGMGVAAIIGLVLDNLIPGTNKERGITE